MSFIRVGAAALNQTPLDWDNNAAHIRSSIREARNCGVSILCLPEMAICGYGCEDAFFADSTHRLSRQVLHELLPETLGIVVCLGFPVLHEGALYNSCALIVDGAIAGIVPKQHLAGDGLHYEYRWFKPWQKGETTEIVLDGQTIPFGDLVFDFNGLRVGFEICEDAWVVQRPAEQLAERGVQVLLNPSASHFAFEKQAIRKRLVKEASGNFGMTYIYSNLVGNEAGRAIYDGGVLIGCDGAIVQQGNRFGYSDVSVTDAVVKIDLSRSETIMNNTGVLRLERAIDEVDEETIVNKPDAFEESNFLVEEEFGRAIALGLYDYVRKSRSRGFVVSLSGGADSTAVVSLIRLMVDFSCDELGTAGVCERLGLEECSKEGILEQLITTVYQSTENSSDATRNTANLVAEGMGSRHLEFDVDALTQSYVSMVEAGIGRELSWNTDDLALQNIQARVRAPGVWMLANIEQKLLLATSNRSEAGVGYATMDGDTCGSISPIAGIDKAFLRKWLVWLEVHGPEGVGPKPSVASVNQLTPTAELRPHEQSQTDEDDLMPYDVLDAIEHEAIGLKHSPAEALVTLQKLFPEHNDMLTAWVKRFYSLWCRNQWKRERYAPSFHVDDKNLDPKTWCRFPILSGGFQRELRELD